MKPEDYTQLRQVIARQLQWVGNLTDDRYRHANAVIDLVERIQTTWRGGPSPETWCEELADLDVGRATTAYVKLRRETDRCPSIAQFISMYRSLDTELPKHLRERCRTCDNTGRVIVEAPEFHQHDCERLPPVNGRYPCEWRCHAAVPCPVCDEGEVRRRQQAKFARVNEWEANTDPILEPDHLSVAELIERGLYKPKRSRP